MNGVKTLLTVSLFALITTVYAAEPLRPPPRVAPAPEEPARAKVRESVAIKGVITSIRRGQMTIRDDRGQTYVLPVTKGVGGREPKVGQRISIKVTCTWPPLECTIRFSSKL